MRLRLRLAAGLTAFRELSCVVIFAVICPFVLEIFLVYFFWGGAGGGRFWKDVNAPRCEEFWQVEASAPRASVGLSRLRAEEARQWRQSFSFFGGVWVHR